MMFYTLFLVVLGTILGSTLVDGADSAVSF